MAEYQNFRKKHRMTMVQIVPLLVPAIERRAAFYRQCKQSDMWCSQWPHFQTWINNERWTDEMPIRETPAAKKPPCQFCGEPATARMDGKGWRCSGRECMREFSLL